MESRFRVPKDVPAAACGRCMWWQQKDDEGWGKCLLKRGTFWYKCMVCCEYEQDVYVKISV